MGIILYYSNIKYFWSSKINSLWLFILFKKFRTLGIYCTLYGTCCNLLYYSFVLCDASFNSWNNQKYLFRKKIKIKTKSYAYNSFSCPSSSRYEMVFYIYTVKPDDHLSCIGGRWCIENKHRLRLLTRWPPVYVYYTQCVHLEHIHLPFRWFKFNVKQLNQLFLFTTG